METTLINNVKNQVREIELTYKNPVQAKDRIKIKNSGDVRNIMRELYDEGQIEYIEQFHVLLLNKANQIIGHKMVSTGSTEGCTVPVKVILPIALKGNAAALIVSHNHPSGNTQPSEADRAITSKLKQAAALLDISLLDHVIVTSDNYYSFADNETF